MAFFLPSTLRLAAKLFATSYPNSSIKPTVSLNLNPLSYREVPFVFPTLSPRR